MINIVNLSYGKDSMATLLLAIEQGIRIDHVMYCDIRFSDEISGEHPLMAEWIPTANKILKDKFGIEVEKAFSISYIDQFLTKKEKGKHIGDIYGYPFIIGAWCNDRLKVRAIKKYLDQFKGQEITQFVGIAYDEQKRWERMRAKETSNSHYRSLLIENELTEQDAFKICEKYNLLSPMYNTKDELYRGGCWFCPKQCMADVYSLWKNYPDLYKKLQDLEKYCEHTTFKPNGSLSEIETKFKNGYIPKRRKKRNQQMTIFEILKED